MRAPADKRIFMRSAHRYWPIGVFGGFFSLLPLASATRCLPRPIDSALVFYSATQPSKYIIVGPYCLTRLLFLLFTSFSASQIESNIGPYSKTSPEMQLIFFIFIISFSFPDISRRERGFGLSMNNLFSLFWAHQARCSSGEQRRIFVKNSPKL